MSQTTTADRPEYNCADLTAGDRHDWRDLEEQARFGVVAQRCSRCGAYRRLARDDERSQP